MEHTKLGYASSHDQTPAELSRPAPRRRPTLLEDFALREKIFHFDHERIPERIVHARGSGAHGFFECTAPIPPPYVSGSEGIAAERGGTKSSDGSSSRVLMR